MKTIPDAIITELLSDQLGLGDDLTPMDDTEDDESAHAAEASAAFEESGDESAEGSGEGSEGSGGSEGSSAALDPHSGETGAVTDAGAERRLCRQAAAGSTRPPEMAQPLSGRDRRRQ